MEKIILLQNKHWKKEIYKGLFQREILNSLLTQNNRIRELTGLTDAMEKLNLSKGIVITFNNEEKVSKNIAIVPFWKMKEVLE